MKHNFDAIRQMIRRRLVESGAPSLGIGVAQDGEIWAEGFGWADRENRIPATEHTMYSVASTTKSFTGTALMVLHEQGKLNVDRPVNDYLGQNKLRARIGDADAVTVRSIMSHVSGLPSYVQFFYEDEPYTCPPRERTILRYGEIMDLPGAHFNYTNLGYAILTHLIECVSGLSYPDFLRQHVFVPLGMHRASIGVEPRLASYAAKRYAANGLPYPYYTFDHLGGSALYVSMHDLMRFALFHLKTPLPDQRPILSDAAIADMQVTRVTIGRDLYYGSGWWIRDDGQGHRIIEHPGGMPGVGSDFMLIPELQLAVAGVVNGQSGGLMREATKALLEMLAPEYARIPPVVDLLQTKKESEPLTPLHGEWAGAVYTHEGQIPCRLWVKDCGDIIAQVGDQLKTLINNVMFREDCLTGTMLGTINTDDAKRVPHQLGLNLRLRQDRLNGPVSALSVPSQGRDAFFTLPYWTELTRS